MSRRAIGIGGAVVVGGATYYLYSAGGDAKVAEKKFERDASRVGTNLGVTGRPKEAKKAGEEGYEVVRAKTEDLTEAARAEANRATQKFDRNVQAYQHDATKKFEETREKAGAEFNNVADKFDKQVHEGIKGTKSWWSGWFK